jgi:hypothetical protein
MINFTKYNPLSYDNPGGGSFMSNVWLGVILAILAGASNNFGIVLQKRGVNALSHDARDKRFFRTLIKSPTWLLGIFLQMSVSTAFLLSAQYFIGPTLVPGLQGIGLVVLVLGSVWLNQENLGFPEYIGVFFLIIATALIGFSELQIEVSDFNFQQVWFFVNTMTYSVILLVICFILEAGQRRSSMFRKGLLLAALSGFCYALTDFWISPLVGTIGPFFRFQVIWIEGALFIIACVLLVSANITAITRVQMSFKYGPASILIPIRYVPSLISPILVYYLVYNKTAPKPYSLWFFLTSIILILLGAYLLARRGLLNASEEPDVEFRDG